MNNNLKAQSTARLEARISPEIKSLLQKAAALEGKTLTDFVVNSVQAEARRVIEQHQTLTLSLQDSEALAEALSNPAIANQSLQSAFTNHQQRFSANGADN